MMSRRYFIDTEYIWDWHAGKVTPVSIGIVDEYGREFYAEYAEGRRAIANKDASDWFMQHVYPVLGWPVHRSKSREAIREELREWIGKQTPEFWGDYAAFDYVVLSMTMGGFDDWPDGWPMHINDLEQVDDPNVDSLVPHNALSDARAVQEYWLTRNEPGADCASTAREIGRKR